MKHDVSLPLNNTKKPFANPIIILNETIHLMFN